MPIYEYVCQNCQNTFEVKQGIKDPPLAACSKCEGPVTKIISAPAIMFKGSGWYVTDYSDKLKPPGQEEAGGKADSEKKEGSTEKKETKDTASTTTATKGETSTTTSSTSDQSGTSKNSTAPSTPSSSASSSSSSSSTPSSSSSKS